MTTDIEKSFKAKLRNIAKEKDRNPADLWQSVVLERFLVRLSHSSHRDHFILKGGVLLAKYVAIGRETQDLDFLGRNTANDPVQLEIKFMEIASIDVNDGFAFRDVKVNELQHPHMSYSGVEVSMIATFGRTRFPIAIDIGFGDAVNAIEKKILLTSSLKGPLFEEQISLLCYPPEFIFAEKLETIVYRGGTNSRMKDFHDLHSMITSVELSMTALRQIIPAVFQHRITSFSLPITFTEEDIALLQNYWTNYRNRLVNPDEQDVPVNITDFLSMLNDRLKAIMK